MTLPKGTFVVGNKLMAKCSDCGKYVQLNKFLVGDLHFCLTEEQRAFRKHFEEEINEVWLTFQEAKRKEAQREKDRGKQEEAKTS